MKLAKRTKIGVVPKRPQSRYRPKAPVEIARNMSAIRATDNRTELLIRKTLFAMGFRYRKYSNRVPGKPDIVFPSAKVAVFIDGDFWHARLLREGGVRAAKAALKTRNREYWLDKFRRRIARDDQVNAVLEAANWVVIRVWESDASKDVLSVAQRIGASVQQRKLLGKVHSS